MGDTAEVFFVISVTHTLRRHKYITFWRPEDAGYCWSISLAGRYGGELVRSALNYYNDGSLNIAVREPAVSALSCAPFDEEPVGNAGPVVLNTAYSWRKLLSATIERPASKPQPEYPGRRKVVA